jgi:hypothetical protein
MTKFDDDKQRPPLTRREFVALMSAGAIVSSSFLAQPSAAALPLKDTLKIKFDWRDLKHRAWENQITARLSSAKDIIAKIFEHRKREAFDGVRSKVIDLVIDQTSIQKCPDLTLRIHPRFGPPCRHRRRNTVCSFAQETCEIAWGVINQEVDQIVDKAVNRNPPDLTEDYEVNIDIGNLGRLAAELDKISLKDRRRSSLRRRYCEQGSELLPT